jgi:hypothetical protein
MSTANKILQRVKKRGRGALFTPKDFLDLGSRDAIDKTLSRLAKQGDIRRLTRGLYDYPKSHSILGSLWPSLSDVAHTIAKDSNSHLQVTGAQALYALGLTTQMPVKAVYLTNGRSRTIKIGNTTLVLKHASPSVMAGNGKKAGLIIQALRYLGKHKVTHSIMQKLALLTDNKDRKQLQQLARFAPPWSRHYIYDLTQS